MITPPKTTNGVCERYIPIPKALLDTIEYAKHDGNIKGSLMGHITFPLAHESQILELEIVPTPEGYPELLPVIFKARIAEGRERLGAWLLEHKDHIEYIDLVDFEFGIGVVFYCPACATNLTLSWESLTGIEY